MRKYTIFHPYVMSFFSKDLYRDVGQNWRGIGAFYLFVLLIISWIFVTILIDRQITLFIQQEAPKMVVQVPTLTIKNGKVSIDKPVPYIIHDTNNKPVIIIDTTGKYQSINDVNIPMLVTADHLYVRKSTNEIREYDFKKIPDLTFGQPQIKYFLHKIAAWGVLILFPFLLMFSFIYRIIQALIYGAIGMLFSALTKARISYQQSLRLAIVAVTPAIIVSTAATLLHTAFHYEYLFYFLISMIYLFIAVYVNKPQPGVSNQEFLTRVHDS